MYFKFTFISFITLLFCFKVNGQKTNILRLQTFIDTSFSNSGHMQTYMIQNRGRDSFKVKKSLNYIIKEFHFQPLQRYYRLLQENKIDESRLNSYKNQYNENIGIFCSDSINNKIQILISLDSQNTKTVIFDVNHNRDFTDDTAYFFKEENDKQKIREFSKKLPIVRLPITYCLDNNLVFLDTMYIRPYPYPSAFTYSDEIENKYYLMIENAMSKKGHLKINKDNYTVIVSNGRPIPLYNIPYTKIFVNHSANNENNSKYYEVLDIVKLKNNAISIDSITKFGDTLYYKNIFNQSFFDPWESKVPRMKLLDINGVAHSIDFNRKVVLLDFWGTWCQPCIENIPKLKALYNKLKDKNFEIISIAYDDKKDFHRLKTLVKKKKMDWINVFQDMDDESRSSLIRKFKITTFPTLILIDKEGDIRFRSSENEDDFYILANKLKFLLDEYN